MQLVPEFLSESNFERNIEPKDAMNTGWVRPQKDDYLIGEQFIYRRNPGNTGTIINRSNGKTAEVNLFALKEAIKMLEQLF